MTNENLLAERGRDEPNSGLRGEYWESPMSSSGLMWADDDD